jgi:hypothetical protein
MSPETLLFLRELLLGMTLNVGAPDYREVSAKVNAALDELDAAIIPANS